MKRGILSPSDDHGMDEAQLRMDLFRDISPAADKTAGFPLSWPCWRLSPPCL